MEGGKTQVIVLDVPNEALLGCSLFDLNKIDILKAKQILSKRKLSNVDETRLQILTPKAKSLDEDLTKVIVGYHHIANDKENESKIGFVNDYKSLIGTPHATSLESLIDSVKVLNNIALQAEYAVLNFQTAISARSILKTITSSKTNLKDELDNYEIELNKLESTAALILTEYQNQLKEVLSCCSVAIEVGSKGEAFRSSNYELLKRDDIWASKYLKMFPPTVNQSAANDYLNDARFDYLGEKFYKSQLLQVKNNMPDLKAIKDEFDYACDIKNKYIKIYRSYVQDDKEENSSYSKK